MMMNWMKSMDLDQMKDQIADLKDQVQDIRFRKPWTRGDETSPLLLLALGAGLAWAASALYKNREEVAGFCSSCGAKLKQTFESSGLKQKAKQAAGEAKETAQATMAAAANGQEPSY